MQHLANRSTFRAVRRTQLPDGANLIRARYTVFIKLDENKEEWYKKRNVSRGNFDIMKDCLVYEAQTIQCIPECIVLIVTKIKCFRTWVVYVKFAYLQSDMPLIRKILITNLAPECELSPEKYLELLKPIYCLAASGYGWHRALDDHVQIDLKWLLPQLIRPYTTNLKMIDLLESMEAICMTFFEQEPMNGKLNQMLYLNGSR